MKKCLTIAATAAGGLIFATCASAATVVMTPSNSDLTYGIYNSGAQTGQTLLFDNIHPEPNPLVVQYQAGAGQTIEEASLQSNGFAWVGGAFNELTITPYAGFSAFSAFKFNFEDPNGNDAPPGGYHNPFELSVGLTFLGGGNQVVTLTGDWANPAKLLITAGAGEKISTIHLYNFGASDSHSGNGDYDYPPPQPFGAIKQASFDAAVVPEPTTWALMILGFGGAGALLRRRRSSLA